MPFIKSGRRAVPPSVIPPSPPPGPKQATQQDEPEQYKKEDREPESEAPRPVPSIAVRWKRHALIAHRLQQAVRKPDVVGHHGSYDAQQHNSQHSDTQKPRSIALHSL